MNVLLCFTSIPSNFFIYASGCASILSALFVILYFFRPFLIMEDISDHPKNIKIKCKNVNLIRTRIKDVHCDIVVSNKRDFEYTKTLTLEKAWVPGIKFCDNYIFKVTENTLKDYAKYGEKEYIKVRILFQNLIGIKKMKERIFEIKR